MFKAFLRFYKKILVYQKKFLALKIFSFLTHALLVFITVYTVSLIGELVDQISNNSVNAVENLIKVFTKIVILVAIPFILDPVTYYIKDQINFRSSRKLLEDLFYRVLRHDYAFHVNKQTGKLITKVIRLPDVHSVILWNLETFLLEKLGLFVFSMILVGMIDYKVSLIILAVVIAELPLFYLAMKFNLKWRKNVNEAEYDRNSVISDGLSNFSLVRAFGNEKLETKNLEKKNATLLYNEVRYSITWRIVDFSVRLMSISVYIVAFAYIVRLYKDGSITVGNIVVIITYLNLILGRLIDFFFDIRSVFRDMPTMSDIMELFEHPLEVKFKDKSSCNCKDSLKGEVMMENVAFTYEDGRKVIKELSLSIPAGSTVAFAGPSGGGKSTIVKLLMRFYDVKSGNIFFDGINIHDFSYEDITSIIGLVPQEPVLFNRSILENVLYGLGETVSNYSEKELKEIAIDACKKAQIHDFIDTLPNKYDTFVGERGIKLSGGQKQRVAIAQIIIKNPKIIIFDEATSQLDSESEAAIQKAFLTLSKDKTTIIIAHRLSTIKNADIIYLIKEGEIVEQGVHDELVKANGEYANLWNIQSGGFVKR